MKNLDIDEIRKKAAPVTQELIEWFLEKKITDDPIHILFILSMTLKRAIRVIESTDPQAAASATHIVIHEITR